MEVFELSLEEIEKKINNGVIVDAKSICGIFYLKSRM